jgi:hypothetical protein
MKSITQVITTAGVLIGAAAVLAIPAAAQKKNKDEVSESITNARYVYVEAYDGPEWNPRLTGEDRKAIADVERAVRSWGRYQLVLGRSEAEVVLQVRKGRIADARVGGGVSVGQVPTHVEFPPTTTTQTTTHGDAGAEVGPPDDLLFVYQATGGELNARLWQRTQKDGLDAPDLKLFQRFKDDVNKSAEAQAKRKAASGGASPAGAPANPGPTGTTGSAPNPNPAPNPPGASRP